jgi:hypothetical protein
MCGNRSCSGADQKTEVYETFPFVISATNALIEILINVERQSHSALAKFVPPLANEPHRIQMLGKAPQAHFVNKETGRAQLVDE